MIPNTRRVAAEARALTLALAVAAKAGWRFDRGPLLTTSFAHFLYVESAQLLLVPTSAALSFAMRQVGPVVRETRSDALIVPSADEHLPMFALASWARRETVWTQPLVSWLAGTGELWLVPLAEPEAPAGVRLGNMLHHVTAMPRTLASERQAGLDRAARLDEGRERMTSVRIDEQIARRSLQPSTSCHADATSRRWSVRYGNIGPFFHGKDQ